MLRSVRPVVRMLGLALLAACGGGDALTGGSPPGQKTASLTVTVSNVPAGATANVSLSGPNGFARTVTATMTITGLTPGSYVVSASEITTEASIFAATPTSQNVELAAGSTRSVDVAYALATGTLELAITGLPASSAAAVTVTGPNNYSRQISATETLVKLAPGTYVVTAAPVTVTGDGYAVAAASRTVDIVATATPLVVGIAYAITTGRLQVTANGLPSGTTPSFQVAGPNGFTQSAPLGQVIVGLAPGTYTIGSPNVVVGGSMYVPGVPSVAITVTASAVPAQATVAYVISGASLSVSVVGLSQAAITVQGPNGYSASATATSTLSGLTAGTYTIVATPVAIGVHRYAGTPATQSVNVPASGSVNASVTYAIATGLISLSITGVPGGSAGAVTVSGPSSFSQVVTSTQLLSTLTPGQYTLRGRAVLVTGGWWSPQPVKQTIAVPASVSAQLAGVGYSNTLGVIAVSVSGLPTGAPAKVYVAGSLGVTDSLSATDTVPSLIAGLYTVTAASVTANGTTYTPALASQPVVVGAGALSAVAVTYVVGGGGGGPGQLNLTIDNLYVTQAVQTYVGDVPLVAGRDGLVRVFVKASSANTAQPQVRVRLYSGTTLLNTLTLTAPASAVPTIVDDATLASAWYGVVSGSLIQPGLRILADVDPSNTVAEGSELDNAWPSSGAAATLFVKTVPTFSLRFVPIKQSNDLTGNVSTANTASFLNDMRRMYPLGTIDVDVRATYTTGAGVVQSNDQNGAWSTLLSEVNALRAVDASTRYYYGVVKTAYSSGIAGMGYLGAPAAIGWDYLPSGADVLAHELGHNWGRYHAPCGGAGSPDPGYPYAGGRIGVSGYDLTMSVFKPATTADVMGYCSPSWVSDFTYKGIMNYRDTHPMVASAQSARAPEPGLLVWGRVSGAQLVLEPAFDVVAPPSLPARSGPHRIEGLADDGSVLFSYGFDGDAIDHTHPQDRHFAFVVPFSVLRGRSLATVRLRARGRVAELRSSIRSVSALADSSVTRVRRVTGRVARVSWSDPNVRGVLVRDARTGEVLTFARGGAANLETRSSNVELVVSDGVRSRTRRLVVR